ncbi:MAG: protein phosphatase 2C domain-containing protein [Propionibacteriaceae bacterium]|jgi:hypothetical protein|nr:protein phosphatase 2C domain-containing protein [Propionibacteriaceae bacterium]
MSSVIPYHLRAAQRRESKFLLADKPMESGHYNTETFFGAHASCIGSNHFFAEPPWPLQDSAFIGVAENLGFIAVADGVSGTSHTSKKSRQLVRESADIAIRTAWTQVKSWADSSGFNIWNTLAWSVMVHTILAKVDHAMRAHAHTARKITGEDLYPASTLVFGVFIPTLRGVSCYWLTVGDSAFGLISAEGIQWLTRHDATYEGRSSSFTNALPGVHSHAEYGIIKLASGQVCFACTDGAARILHVNEKHLAATRTPDIADGSLLKKYLLRLVEDCAAQTGDDASVAALVMR